MYSMYIDVFCVCNVSYTIKTVWCEFRYVFVRDTPTHNIHTP